MKTLRLYRRGIYLLGWLLGIWLSACHSPPVTRTIMVKAPEPDTLTATVLKRYAQRLEVPVDSLRKPALYQFVDRWLAPSAADSTVVDNAEFARKLYDEVYQHSLTETVASQFSSPDTYLFKGRAYLQEGDLVFFRQPHQEQASYVGVYLNNGYFVHAIAPDQEKGRVQISTLTEEPWKVLFVAAGRVKRL